MRSFLWGFFAISCFALYINGEEIPPIPNSRRVAPVFRAFTRAAEGCQGGDPANSTPAPDLDQWKCLDCKTMVKCSNIKDKPAAIVTCVDQFPTKPLCNETETNAAKKCIVNTGACVDKLDFICPGRGLYPTLTKCTNYYKCTAAKAFGVPYECAPTTYFSYEKKACITGATSACYNVETDCGNKNKLIPYKPDPNLYVQCETDKSPTLYKCDGDLVFSQNLLQCAHNCTSEGKFPNHDKLSSYYRCTPSGKGTFNVEIIDCKDGEIYDNEFKDCF